MRNELSPCYVVLQTKRHQFRWSSRWCPCPIPGHIDATQHRQNDYDDDDSLLHWIATLLYPHNEMTYP